MNKNENIPLEVLADLEIMNRQFEKMNKNQLIDYTKELYKSYKVQQVYYKNLLAKEWGIKN